MRHPTFFALLVMPFALFGETPRQAAPLYNGKDLAGWEYVTPGKESINEICHPKPDGVLVIDGKPNGYLATSASYENYVLHVEWRWSDKPGNAGILVHITDGPMDRIWPISFQIQTKNTRVGDVLPMSTAKFAEAATPKMTPDQVARFGADSEKPVGEWNSSDIICRGDTIEVTVNGMLQNKVTRCVPSSGKIGFQLEGVPYELRNIRIEPLPRAIGRSGQTAPGGR